MPQARSANLLISRARVGGDYRLHPVTLFVRLNSMMRLMSMYRSPNPTRSSSSSRINFRDSRPMRGQFAADVRPVLPRLALKWYSMSWLFHQPHSRGLSIVVQRTKSSRSCSTARPDIVNAGRAENGGFPAADSRYRDAFYRQQTDQSSSSTPCCPHRAAQLLLQPCRREVVLHRPFDFGKTTISRVDD